MQKTRLFQWIFTLYSVMISSCWVSSAQETPIRVAFLPQQEGFYHIEENGGYAGYYYDYLMEVAEYTDWTYEFVVIDEGWDSYAIAKEMLLADEIDLLGPMFDNDEQADSFLYGQKPNGLSRHTLCTSPSSSVTVDNFFFQPLLTVALVSDNQESIDAFKNLMELYEIEYEITFVEAQEEAIQLLSQRKVDTVMSMDVFQNYGLLEPLDSIDPTPFYFVTTPDKDNLMQELDLAVAKLDIVEPTLHQRLRDLYFSSYYEGTLVYSAEEERALENYDYLTVGLMRNMTPYQFYDEDSTAVAGISTEIMEMISDIIGVEFRYVWVEDAEELTEKVANREIDVCASLPFDYALASQFGIVLTRPYLTSSVMWLHNSSEQQDVDYYYHFVTDNIPQVSDDDLIRVDDIEETIRRISNKGDISLICDPYIAQYYIQKLSIMNVDMQSLSSVQSEITLGVGKHVDITIVGLLNRAILHLNDHDVDEIVYRNIIHSGPITLEAFFRQNLALVFLTVVAIFALIVLALSYHARKMRILAQQDGLTKLYNSGYFHHYADEKSKKLSCGVLILFDIDYFKQVNDTHGHQMGDKVIVSVARNVEKLFDDHGVVARLGGDEFVALVEGERSEMEEKCALLQKELDTSVENVPISLSIGGIRFHEPTPYKELYRLADECLYEVKENGKKGFHFGEKESNHHKK